MAQKKATYKVYNGSNFDEIMLKTLASQVIQDATHRFITDTEKTNWNGAVTKLNNFLLSLATGSPNDHEYFYCKIPMSNGKYLILEAGWGAPTSSSYMKVTFPLAFPTKCMSFIAQKYWVNGGTSGTFTITELSTTAAVGATGGTGDFFYWIAIGY